MAIHRNILRYGSPDPLPEAVPLRAGPISCTFVAGELRDIALGGQIALRRIYVAVRDAHWGTVPAILSQVEIARRERDFAIHFEAEHHEGGIHFAWHGAFLGDAQGALTIAMEGEALEEILTNRIGLCVLYPEACAGTRCLVEHTDGSVEEGHFPQAISPHQPFFAIRSITHDALPGVQVRVTFEGDTFEMEDQRNWSDASFKVYSRPLALPYPFLCRRGERIHQAVRVEALGNAPYATVNDEPTFLEITSQRAGRLPDLGFGIPHSQLAPAGQERERLKAILPVHLRLDLDLTFEDWPRDAERAVAWARALNAPLEVALFIPEAAESALQGCAQAMRACEAPVCRWLLYGQGRLATPPGLVPLARQMLGPLAREAEFAIGTPAHFTELNRVRPGLEGAEAVAWSLTPQVHAFDNASLMETLAIQGVIAENARALYPHARRIVSPITLKPRPSLADVRKQGSHALGVDMRQPSLFAAAWTVGSLKYLAEAGVASITYFEALGPRGLMDERSVFPAYHVLAWLAPWRGAEVFRVASSAPLRAVALALRKGEKSAALVANLTNAPQGAFLKPVARAVHLLRLNELNAEAAMDQPEGDWPLRATLEPTAQGLLPLLLWPYEAVWVEGF